MRAVQQILIYCETFYSYRLAARTARINCLVVCYLFLSILLPAQAYTREQILGMEAQMLNTLDFRIS